MVRTLLGTFFLLGCLSALANETIPPDKEILYFDRSPMGVVTFLHKMHSTLDGVTCTTCHHTSKGDSKKEDCHNCHKPDMEGDVPESVIAFHTRCRGCHEYTVQSGKKAGPVRRCKLCHICPDDQQPEIQK